MRATWKAILAVVAVTALAAGPYLVVRAHRATPRAAQTAAFAADGVSQDEAVQIAQGFMAAVGWHPEGQAVVKDMPETDSYGPAWDVSWFRMPGHDHEWTAGVHTGTGQILRAMEYYQDQSLRAHSGPPDVPISELAESATRFAQAAGLPADARLAEGKLSPGWQGRGAREEFVIKFGRFFGDAQYKDDGMTLWLHPDTGKVARMGSRCRMQPPPDVPRNISQKEAIELGKQYLDGPTVMGSATVETQDAKKVRPMVVAPLSEATPGYGHYGEPSRIAWVVEYSRAEEMPGGAVDSSHVVEAWVDVEDGSFLGTVRCK